jgi:hypothetical protein
LGLQASLLRRLDDMSIAALGASAYIRATA